MSVSTNLKAVVRLQNSRIVDLIEAYNNLYDLGIDIPEDLTDELDVNHVDYEDGEKIVVDGSYISVWVGEIDKRIDVGIDDYGTTQLYAVKDFPKGTEYVAITITC